jgi:hypothetical protein
VKAFNNMLREIETRDGRLAEQRAHLEEQVTCVPLIWNWRATLRWRPTGSRASFWPA